MKLSKRETILLIFLLIIGLFFVEYRFVVVPGIEKFNTLSAQDEELAAQVDSINLKITIAERNKEKRDKLLAQIDESSKPFLNSLKSDVLLNYTYDLMNRNGFLPMYYSIYPIELTAPNPEAIIIQELSYELAKTAQNYNSVRAEAGSQEPAAPAAANLSEIETAVYLVSATGSYEQLKQLLNDLHSQNRTIMVSSLDIEPLEGGMDGELPVEPALPNQLGFNILIKYYGLEKIKPTEDEFNTWPRSAYKSGTENPFVPAPTELTTEETTAVTTETSAA